MIHLSGLFSFNTKQSSKATINTAILGSNENAETGRPETDTDIEQHEIPVEWTQDAWREFCSTEMDHPNESGIFRLPFDIEKRDYVNLPLPEPLELAGLPQEEWRFWMEELSKVQKLKWSKDCKHSACASIVLLWVVLFPFLGLYLCAEGRMNRLWSDALLKWQKNFNEQCLQHYGIYCKTQSYGYPRNNFCECTVMGDSEYERWIAFAVAPAAIERLRSQNHIQGHTVDCRCCGHAPESELCMHPEYHIEWDMPTSHGLG